MKNVACILFFFVLWKLTIYAQNTPQEPNMNGTSEYIKHAVHCEISTLFFWGFASINYEITLNQTPGKSIYRFKTGFIYRYDDHFYGIPINLTALYGKNANYFELTTGIAPVMKEDWHEGTLNRNGYTDHKLSFYPIIDIGFRHEPGKEKPFYRIKVGTSGLGIGVGITF